MRIPVSNKKVMNWTCPHCEKPVSIGSFDIKTCQMLVDIDNDEGDFFVHSQVTVCPNVNCHKPSLEITTANLLGEGTTAANRPGYTPAIGETKKSWRLIPEASVRQFSPSIIPLVILADYKEACLIRDLSPKAAATLARRCLQGMIRDFWDVKTGSLFQQIQAIKCKVLPDVWNAIDAVRTLGNIGAHMEKDINLIIDVDPEEAQTLIELIEMLIEEWYIARNEREKRLASISAIATQKIQQKEQGKTINETNAEQSTNG